MHWYVINMCFCFWFATLFFILWLLWHSKVFKRRNYNNGKTLRSIFHSVKIETRYMPIDNRFVEVKTRDWRSQKYCAHITQPKNWAFPFFPSNNCTKLYAKLLRFSAVFGILKFSIRRMCTKHVDFPFARIQHNFIDLCEQAVLHCCCLCFSVNVGENAGMRTPLQLQFLVLPMCTYKYIHCSADTREKGKIQWFWFKNDQCNTVRYTGFGSLVTIHLNWMWLNKVKSLERCTASSKGCAQKP